MAQTIKSLPAMQKTQLRSLGQEDPLEEEMTTHSNILAWETPWTEEPGRLQSRGSHRVRHNWSTDTHYEHIARRMCFFWFLLIFYFFLMWTIFKVFVEFVTILLLFYLLVFGPGITWDLSFPTRNQTCTLCIGRGGGLNRWTTREVPALFLYCDRLRV